MSKQADLFENISSRKAPWVGIAANPFSGSGENKGCVDALVADLEEAGITSRMIWDPAGRKALFREADADASCLCMVVAGGDGTLADTINETPTVPLAVLPLGNENLFAREFGYTKDTGKLAKAIARQQCRAVDLGRAGEQLFSVMLGAGFDAEVVHRTTEWRKSGGSLKRATRLSYSRPVLSAIAGYAYPPVTVEADGVMHFGAQALVFNLPRYGGGLDMNPDARGDDGLLDWLLIEKPGILPMLACAISAWRHKLLQQKSVLHGRAQRIRIASPEPVPLQMDGDPAGFTPVEIEVVPQALRIVDMREEKYE